MRERQSYPVIVEYSQRHIVWVEADTGERAVERVASFPYDHTKDDETLAISGLAVRAPKDHWDWEEVNGEVDSFAPYTTEADAHVETHRNEMRRQQEAAERAACTAEGHPDTKPPIWDGRIWCNRCRLYLEPSAEVA